MLIVSAHWRSAFEWEAHGAIGRAVGVTEQELAAIAAGTLPDLTDRRELLCARLVMSLVEGDVDDALWDDAVDAIGVETIYEFTTLVGYYALLALQLRVFRVDESSIFGGPS